MPVRYTHNIPLNLSFESAFDLCLASIQSLTGYILTSQDRQSGHIRAMIGMDQTAPGEFIEWHLQSVDETRTQIKIVSKTNSLYRWRRAGENLNAIVRFLMQDKGLLLRPASKPETEYSALLHPAHLEAETDPQQLLRAGGQGESTELDPSGIERE